MASYIKEAPHSERTAQADAHFDTAAFWRDMVIGLEEQNAALKAKVSRLEARIDELQGEETTWMQDNASPKLETSTRSQRLKRTMDRALEKDVSGTGSKRARILADPTLDESRSEWDELGE